MPKSTMTAAEDQTTAWPDGGVPDLQVSQPKDRKICCEEHRYLERGDIINTGSVGSVQWEVRGWGDDGRLWVRSTGGNTRWFTCTVEQPACTPEDSPVCKCGIGNEGFTLDPETDFWVHAKCWKPTAAWLSGHVARQGMVSW